MYVYTTKKKMYLFQNLTRPTKIKIMGSHLRVWQYVLVIQYVYLKMSLKFFILQIVNWQNYLNKKNCPNLIITIFPLAVEFLNLQLLPTLLPLSSYGIYWTVPLKLFQRVKSRSFRDNILIHIDRCVVSVRDEALESWCTSYFFFFFTKRYWNYASYAVDTYVLWARMIKIKKRKKIKIKNSKFKIWYQHSYLLILYKFKLIFLLVFHINTHNCT